MRINQIAYGYAFEKDKKRWQLSEHTTELQKKSKQSKNNASGDAQLLTTKVF